MDKLLKLRIILTTIIVTLTVEIIAVSVLSGLDVIRIGINAGNSDPAPVIVSSPSDVTIKQSEELATDSTTEETAVESTTDTQETEGTTKSTNKKSGKKTTTTTAKTTTTKKNTGDNDGEWINGWF